MTSRRTVFGNMIDHIKNQNMGSRVARYQTPLFGVIIDEDFEKYAVRVRWNANQSKQGESDWIPLLTHPNQMASTYGPLDSSTKPITARGLSVQVRNNFAEIIADPNQDYTYAAGWGELEMQGAAFAPPGKGTL